MVSLHTDGNGFLTHQRQLLHQTRCHLQQVRHRRILHVDKSHLSSHHHVIVLVHGNRIDQRLRPEDVVDGEFGRVVGTDAHQDNSRTIGCQSLGKGQERAQSNQL